MDPPEHTQYRNILQKAFRPAVVMGWGEKIVAPVVEEPIAVEAGEVIVFTKGDPHVMSSGPGMRGDPFAPSVIDAATSSQLPFLINFGSTGPATKLVFGFLACDAQPFNPLLDNLPPVIKAGDPQNRDTGWFGQFIRFARMESADKRVGGESVLARLSELMFIEVVRRYLEGLPPGQAGWLAGLRDPLIGKALSLLHGEPAPYITALREAGLAVELLETRHVRDAFKAMPVKSDRNDARGIAQLMRLGWFRPVHCKSIEAQETRAVLSARNSELLPVTCLI